MSANQRYADAASDIYLKQGDSAARDIAQRGQIWGGAISQIGQIAGQTLTNFAGAKQDEKIHAVFEKYGADFEKAIPEVMAIDPDKGMKIADQVFKQQKWAFDLQDEAWKAGGRKLIKLRELLDGVRDQGTYTAALYGARLAGLEGIDGADPTYDPAKVAQWKGQLQEAYQTHQGAVPKAPEPFSLSPGQKRFDSTGKEIASVPPTPDKPPQPSYEQSVYTDAVRAEQAAAGAQQGATVAPTAPPTAPAAPASLSVAQVEGRAPAPSAAPSTPAAPPDYGYGNRYGTNTPKGLGFLGPLKRPDGGVMSEYSIGVDLDGKRVEIPSIVPTLTKGEVEQLLRMKESDPLPKNIVDKAIAYAKTRMAAGKDPFAGPGEQQVRYPDLVAPTPSVVAPGAGAQAPPLTEAQIKLEGLKRQAAAKKKEEEAKHSPAFVEWQDYKANGGTLSFDAYMTQDANRKAVRVNTGGAEDRVLVPIIGPDGKAVLVPRSEAVGKTPASAGSGAKPPTGAQNKTLGFFNRAKQADDDLQDLEARIAKKGYFEQAWMNKAPNVLQSSDGQRYTQAQRAFTEARLRKDSGAAIPESEFENDRQTYFVQPGDDAKTIAQKARARAAVLASLAFESGGALEGFYGDEAASMIEGFRTRSAKGGKPPAAAAPPPAPPGWKYVAKPGGGWTAVEVK